MANPPRKTLSPMTSSKNEQIVFVGSGGHGRVLYDALRASGGSIAGYVAKERAAADGPFGSIEHLGGDDALIARGPSGLTLVNAIGSVDVPSHRAGVFEKFKGHGFSFMTVVHQSAVVAADADLGEGAQIMAGAIVQSGASIGANSIVNTGAVVDHDAVVGESVHIGLMAAVGGGVYIGPASHVGAGAVLIQGVRVGSGALIGAGAVVVDDVGDRARVAGVPARSISRT
jgi:sugar O-acyltransferase (sialic acid O-acetyltransferase NeuD family)